MFLSITDSQWSIIWSLDQYKEIIGVVSIMILTNQYNPSTPHTCIFKKGWISECIFYLRIPFNFHKSLNKPVIPPYILQLKQIIELANIIFEHLPMLTNP